MRKLLRGDSPDGGTTMNARQRTYFWNLLRRERSALVHELGDVGSGGNGLAVAEDDVAIAVHERAELADVDAALLLLTETPEQYGVCSVCGHDIGVERLRLVPTTRVCAEHAAPS
jgi:hypothetical protein